MHAVGAPVRRRLGLSATPSRRRIAGVAGGVWAQANAYVNLGTLGLDRAATVLIILVLGGYGRLYGAFVGAVAYMALSHFLAEDLSHGVAARTSGSCCVVIALFARNGILGIVDGAAGRATSATARARLVTTPLLETRALCRNFGALRRRARHRLPARGRRAPRADRPERRRQDHVRQPAHRRHPPTVGRRSC